MRIKKWLFPTPPPADVWFHASRITSRTVSRTKLDTDPRESSSGLESDIYYKRGVVFVVPLGKKLYSLLSRRILSITVLLEKKKKRILFFWNFIVFPRNFSTRFIIECTARWPWRGRLAVVSIESCRKNGSPRNKVGREMRPLKEARDDDGAGFN